MYLRAKFNIKRGHGSWLAGLICRTSAPGIIRSSPATLEGSLEGWQRVVNVEQARYKEAKEHQAVMAYRFEMIAVINQAQAEHRTEFKRFAILPVLSEGVQFVTLDNRGMQFLAALAKRMFPNHDKEVISQAFASLDTFFDRTKGIKKKPHHVLSPCVRTNGVELHVMFEKNTPRYQDGRMKGKMKRLKLEQKIKPEHLDPEYEMDDVRGLGQIRRDDIVAVDPGNKNPYTAVRCTDRTFKGKPLFETRTVSKAEYNLKSKRTKTKKRADRDRKRFGLVEVEDQMASLSFKTDAFEVVKAAVHLRLRHHQRMHDAQSNRQKLKLKFEARIAEQRQIDAILKDLTFGFEAKVVVIGDGSRMSGIRGTTCGVPNSKIKRKAVKVGKERGFFVKSADESYTSRRSWCCKGRDMTNMKTGNQRDAEGRRSKVHGLCICTGCHKVWSRDVNGAINIWHVAVNKLRNQGRPWWLEASISGTHSNIVPGTAGDLLLQIPLVLYNGGSSVSVNAT
ncbi:Hypothetical protein SCF082_LOCUS13902 [Durusdinium trenchii]|uniref:Cas12f1-like TNB domain-containing protein n=1 Tax=Durusdinium trenchii TaxID=1381693 RepID=A0ABP0JU49_9DINO